MSHPQIIKDKVEAKLHKSGLEDDAKDEIRSGVEETITESLAEEKRGVKIDWPTILNEILALVEAYIASANTVPTPPAKK